MGGIKYDIDERDVDPRPLRGRKVAFVFVHGGNRLGATSCWTR